MVEGNLLEIDSPNRTTPLQQGEAEGGQGDPCFLSKDFFENICDPTLPR